MHHKGSFSTTLSARNNLIELAKKRSESDGRSYIDATHYGEENALICASDIPYPFCGMRFSKSTHLGKTIIQLIRDIEKIPIETLSIICRFSQTNESHIIGILIRKRGLLFKCLIEDPNDPNGHKKISLHHESIHSDSMCFWTILEIQNYVYHVLRFGKFNPVNTAASLFCFTKNEKLKLPVTFPERSDFSNDQMFNDFITQISISIIFEMQIKLREAAINYLLALWSKTNAKLNMDLQVNNSNLQHAAHMFRYFEILNHISIVH